MSKKNKDISLDLIDATSVLNTSSSISHNSDVDPRISNKWNVYNTTPYSFINNFSKQIDRQTLLDHNSLESVVILRNYINHLSQCFTIKLGKEWVIKPHRFIDKVVRNNNYAIIKVGDNFQLLKYKNVSEKKDFNGIYPEIEIVEETSILKGKIYDYYENEFVPLNLWDDNVNPQAIILNYVNIIGALKNEMIFNGISSLPTLIAVPNNAFDEEESQINLETKLSDNNAKSVVIGDVLKSSDFKQIDRRDNIDTYINTIQYFENHLKEHLGIPVNDIRKKERMITSEIGQQQSLNQAVIDRLFNVMKETFEEANQKLGCNISVELTLPSVEIGQGFEDKEEKEGDENELISKQ